MDKILFIGILVLFAFFISQMLQRKKSEQPISVSYHIPQQIRRSDFLFTDTDWFVAVFTSDNCDVCKDVAAKTLPLQSSEVGVQIVEVSENKQLHEKYNIDAVPLVLIADDEGIVQGHFLGPCTATDIWAKVANLRDPDAEPLECSKHKTEI